MITRDGYLDALFYQNTHTKLYKITGDEPAPAKTQQLSRVLFKACPNSQRLQQYSKDRSFSKIETKMSYSTYRVKKSLQIWFLGSKVNLEQHVTINHVSTHLKCFMRKARHPANGMQQQ